MKDDTSNTHGKVSGRLLVVALLLAVLIVGAYAVWRIVLSTEESTGRDTAISPVDSTAERPGAPPQAGMPAYQLTEEDVETLKAKGLEDPINDILNDLKNHPELIPTPGTMGGTMTFWPSESRVISRNRVNAYFEDGHIGGRLLLEFAVRDGVITWTVIERLPD